MTQRPLLIFPARGEASRSQLHGGGGNIHTPSGRAQYNRLNPKFEALNNLLNDRQISFQNNPDGIMPEMVLVFDTVGRVEDFIKAVNKIEGLEWLGDIDKESIEPDEDFYEIKRGERSDSALDRRLYMTFTNARAMQELLSLWNLYKDNERVKFSGGKTKLRDVFKHLKDIRKWGEQDRFSDSNILSIWRESLQLFPDRVVRFEVELWYRNMAYKRANSYNSVKKLIEDLGGKVISSCDIPAISYHALLAELPATEIEKILNHESTELVKCENIMFFRPCGQVICKENYDPETFEDVTEVPNPRLPNGTPVIAVLDGLPLANHTILRERLIIEDTDNLESRYRADDRKHGTMICSLIAYGDLNKNEQPISTPLYVRPIMCPDESLPNRYECVPDDFLLVDMIHRAVKQMFEGSPENSPTAPTVRVINLSIGDSDRPFFYSMSPCAKLLDWLSYKYQVLFIVSAGNCIRDINIGIPERDFNFLEAIEKEKLIINALLKDRRYRRILSPAESINSLTVGSVHSDYSTFYPNERRVNPYSAMLPATYSPVCSGYRKAIKPDLVYEGGKQMFEFSLIRPKILCPKNYSSPPGQKVAAPGRTSSQTAHSIGTSNSAALVSRLAHFCFDTLNDIFEEENLDSVNVSLLIKAMLAHGCSWNSIEQEIEKRVDIADRREKKQIKNALFGYGIPDISKVMECTEQRATVIGYGDLPEEGAHIYSLPLPPSLSSQRVRRRLTITLAWFSPISPHNQKYRTSKLWFEAKNRIASGRINSDWQAVTRGTLQHEIFEGEDAAAFVEGDAIQIKVNRTADAASYPHNIPYALVVSLEVAEGIPMPIYQEIKDRIAVPVAVRQEL